MRRSSQSTAETAVSLARGEDEPQFMQEKKLGANPHNG